jgi:flagellin-like hook-associated protein FlgL
MALEMIGFVKNRILMQSGTSMLVHANLQNQAVLN